MENPINSENYHQAKEDAKSAYAKIKNVWCPALGDDIIFSKTGFRHLIRKGRENRFKSEQKRRFALIPDIEIILKNSRNFTQREIENKGKKILFWTFTEHLNAKTVKVVVRQIEGQKKKFLSVFERNKKSTPNE